MGCFNSLLYPTSVFHRDFFSALRKMAERGGKWSHGVSGTLVGSGGSGVDHLMRDSGGKRLMKNNCAS